MRTLVYVFLIAIVGVACNNEATQAPKKLSPEELKQEAYDEIMAMEKSMMAVQNNDLDTMKATKLSKLYVAYAMNNNKDAVALDFMFKAGELRMGVGQYLKSIEIFEQLNRSFPNHEKAAETDYLVAFIYHNYLMNLGTAEAKYQLVIDKYPNHDLAQDARVAVKTLGMSDEELIEMFEKKNGV